MRSKLIKITALFILLTLAAGPALAREFTIVGPRALGMGGAGVAVANDSSATYWNPASYGFFGKKPAVGAADEYGKRDFSAAISGGFGNQVHEDLGTLLDMISVFDFNNFSGGTITADMVPDFFNLVNELKTFSENDASALTVKFNAGATLQASHFGAGGLFLSEISAKGDLDLVNVGVVLPGGTFTLNDFTNPANYGCPAPCTGGTYLNVSEKTQLDTFLTGLGWTATQRTDFINAVDYGLTQANASGVVIPGDIVTQVENVAAIADTVAGAGGSFADNTSRLLFKGIGVAEVPVSFGFSLTDSIAVGANVKYMRARVYNTAVPVFNTDFSTALDAATNDFKDSSNLGVDLGVLFRAGDAFTMGVLARNVNSPEFDMKTLLPGDTDSITEKPQVRIGLAFKPLDYLTIAVDYDLTENDTTVSENFKSRNLGGGVELDLFKFLRVRGGAYKNTAADDIGIVYTAGAGLNLWVVSIDAGASFSQDATTINGTTIPEEFKAEFALSAFF